MKRFRWKNFIDGKDMMVTAQLKCGCVFGEVENEKGILYCEEHEAKTLCTKH